MKKNLDVRVSALVNDVYLSSLADFVGIPRNEFYKKLRYRELPKHEKARLLDAIETISK